MAFMRTTAARSLALVALAAFLLLGGYPHGHRPIDEFSDGARECSPAMGDGCAVQAQPPGASLHERCAICFFQRIASQGHLSDGPVPVDTVVEIGALEPPSGPRLRFLSIWEDPRGPPSS